MKHEIVTPGITIVTSSFTYVESQTNWFNIHNNSYSSNYNNPYLSTHPSTFIPVEDGIAAKGGSIMHSSITLFAEKYDVVLSEGGKRCLETPNAGGNSVWSEVISYEILRYAYGAELLRTEMEIEYRCGSKITDFSVMIGKNHLGVSVTRAMSFGSKLFDLKESKRLLKKKLQGVKASTRGVIKAHRWSKQILHILCQSEENKDMILKSYELIKQKVKHDTIVLVTVTHGKTNFIYTNNKR